MKYSPYEFKEQDAYDFARHVGIKTYPKGEELFFVSCPYCHGRGKQNEKTFSINTKLGVFKCFRDSCGVTGNMVTLARDFDFSLGNEVDEYYKPKKQYRRLKTPQVPIQPKEPAIKYLESRGISERIGRKYEITTQSGHDNVLVFPFFDQNSKLQFVKYRKTDFDKEKDNCKEWCEKDCRPILFGMNQTNKAKSNSLVITEGQMDSLAVAEAFDGEINVVSVPTGSKGFTWIPHCWDWINGWKEIVVFGDHEKGRITLLEDLKKRLKITIKHVREEDYKDCKDANDILLKYGAEQVRKCVRDAVQIPVSRVIQLADVEDIDIFEIPKLHTGITVVDKLLYGGIPFGGITLVSGKAGQGKSTLASQIMVNAIDQGYTCFAYSGELPNYLFKAWMEFQIAGKNHVYEYYNNWGDLNFKVSSGNKDLISTWLRDKFYLYDNRMIEGSETESLVKTIENVILQYGVKVILIDNLMTAIDLEAVQGDDKYERQSKFVKALSRIAMQYDVVILLVAHKRKNSFGSNENDEIAGSSDIGNLALITLAYEKDDKLVEDQRLLKVSKNRLFGKTNNQGWVTYYEEKSKRIYSVGDKVDKEFGWLKSDFDSMDSGEETPFD